MFDKLKQGKQLLELRNKAKKLQSQLEEIFHTEERDNMQLTVNGSQKVVSFKIDGEERRDLVEIINKAMGEVQKKAAKKMMEEGGGLGGLLGGMS